MRPHTEQIRPPRALWVPFILGRPLGVPGDTAFQTRVITAALQLLERPTGPVLEDYDLDAPEPDDDEQPTILACPVPQRTSTTTDAESEPSVRALLAAEIAFLRPWYQQGRAARDRTTVGVSGLTPEAAADLLADWIEQGDASGIPANRLKLAIDDLRAYCLEAGTAQPGAGSNQTRLEHWYWWQTAIGRALREAHPQAVTSQDHEYRMLGKVVMIPVAQLGRSLPSLE